MTLTVNQKIYDVTQNGTDYVTKEQPRKEDFQGVFSVSIDGEIMQGMTLAGIQELNDGWHISLYQMSENELIESEMRVLAEITAQNVDDVDAEKIKDLFPSWNGDGTAYPEGFRVKYDGLLYRCVQAHTSQPDWTPPAAPSLWTRASDPAAEYPEWIQPAGAHNAYNTGDKVSHNEKRWISTTDGNIWEPGVYGWDEVTA